ncbi:MAG: Hsp20/alpha crystallin family protein [Clostridia bacterium]|nr:Hsp20/alpha crystallin family protein [Clostridia bacterium]
MFELIRKNNAVNRYDPFREMEEMEKAFFSRPWNSFFESTALTAFKTDITEEEDYFLLEADLPGFDKKDIQLELEDDVLTVRAERKSKTENKDKKGKVIRMERSYGSYMRQFNLSGVDVDKIKAKYDNGVLQLILPKMQEKLSKKKQLSLE